LKSDEKERLKILVDSWQPENVGLIVRTNAGSAEEAVLEAEYRKLEEKFRFLSMEAVHRSLYSCVMKSRPSYLTSILGSRSDTLKEIVTDDRELYGQIREFLQEEMPEDVTKLRLYEERMQPLSAVWRLDKGIADVLSPRVWLRSGAYLVIEQTEALTVIDVNTGKYTGGKNKQETVRKINREAAAEITRQLRLRNLSGIILVDFVDMDKQEDSEQLLELMREYLKSDPLKAAAVDMTRLGLMELTRKKQKKTLMEQAKECGL
jgi:ribonuclease G